ncbi:hypothetical protein [Burkholderia pyrrocinia]|uniref:hypothetical protein n=1 Tax=Burkholderia pyrrocinia TaxID=60550 RepID=UPI001BCA8E9E|nr:hypothetical protein [Burkholderia pyrrocinia]QVN18968.1 hypothetical protein JYG32_04310 [Burkholderia pyrrocinia]
MPYCMRLTPDVLIALEVIAPRDRLPPQPHDIVIVGEAGYVNDEEPEWMSKSDQASLFDAT